MPEDFISRPEFNNSMTAVRDEIKRVGESVTQVSVKIDTLVNGRILAFVTRGIKALLIAPPTTVSVGNSLSGYTRNFGPLRNARSFPANGYNHIIPSVSALFLGRRPPAISRAIVGVAINPIYRVGW